MSVRGIPVLIYHAIDNNLSAEQRTVSVSLSSFREQMAWLHQAGYKSVKKEDLRDIILQGKRIDGKYVHITFDDGYHSLHKYALEIMSQYGFVGTLFLSTSFIGKTYDQKDFAFVKHDRQLTWDEIKTLQANGWSIQSHGHNHNRMKNLSEETIINEVTLSKQIIEQNLGTAVDEFAYPYGIYTSIAIKQLKAAGYNFAYSVHSGKLSARASRYRLPRIEINSADNMDSFKTKVTTGHISSAVARRAKIRDIIYANPAIKDFIERWTPYFGFGNH